MINTIIFDLGGVLIDWNPQYLFSQIFEDKAEMQYFLEKVCTPDWNEEQDAGRTIKEATEQLVKEHPAHAQNIHAYYDRWHEMLGGTIDGTVEIFRKLKDSNKYKIYALTNWSGETFPIALNQYELFKWFDGIVVSGTEKMRKPSPHFYKLLLDRYDVKAGEALFIDDNLRNIKAAKEAGIHSIHFLNPQQLEQELKAMDIAI